MDSGSVEEVLCHFDNLSCTDDSCNLGRCRPVPGWKGKCIGDGVSTISEKVARVVAFQVAGCIGEVGEWVDDAVS